MAKQQNQNLSPENYIRQRARTLPIYECFVNSHWEESQMANIVVSRKHTNGNYTMGFYLVDLLCRGVKDTFFLFNESEIKYREILDEIATENGLEPIEYVLAHNIIFAGIEFADEYGFKPHKDFTNLTRFILEEDNDDIELMDIECGHDGYPAVVVFEDNREEAEKQIRTMQKLDYPEGFIVVDMINDRTVPGEFYFDEDYEDYEDEDFEDDEDIDFDNDFIDFTESLRYKDEIEKAEEEEFIYNNINTPFLQQNNNDAAILLFEKKVKYFVNFHGVDYLIDKYHKLSPFIENNDLIFDPKDDFLITGGQKLMPTLIEQIVETDSKIGEVNSPAEDTKDAIQKFPNVPYFYFFDFLESINNKDYAKEKLAIIDAKFPKYWLTAILNELQEITPGSSIHILDQLCIGISPLDIPAVGRQISSREKTLLTFILFQYFVRSENLPMLYILNNQMDKLNSKNIDEDENGDIWTNLTYLSIIDWVNTKIQENRGSMLLS